MLAMAGLADMRSQPGKVLRLTQAVQQTWWAVEADAKQCD